MDIGGASKLTSNKKDIIFMLNRPQENTITKDSLNLRSYSQVVKGQHEGQPHQNIDLQNFELPESSSVQLEGLQLKTPSMSQGTPALHFTVSEKSHLLGKLKYVLVGKFSHGRPAWSSVKSFFSGLKLNGPHNISVFDNKHIYIECSNIGDFNRIWLRLNWSIDGHVMRIFKWGPHFNPLIENPIAPVWIRMEGLPLYMFDEMALMNLANVIGSPIKIDARNLNRSKLNSASVCVELDVTKPLVDSVKVVFVEEKSGVNVDEFSVQVFYDYVPPYCSSCLHIGHFHTKCKIIKADILEVEAHSQRQGKEQAAQTVSILESGKAAAQHKRVWKTVALESCNAGPEQVVNAAKLTIESDQQIEKTLLLQNQFQTLKMDGADLALMNEKLLVTEATELKELPAASTLNHMAAVNSSHIESNANAQFDEINTEDGRAVDIVSEELIVAGKISQQTLQFAESHMANTTVAVEECILDSAVQASTEHELAVGTGFAANESVQTDGKDESNALVAWKEVAASKVCVTPVPQQTRIQIELADKMQKEFDTGEQKEIQVGAKKKDNKQPIYLVEKVTPQPAAVNMEFSAECSNSELGKLEITLDQTTPCKGDNKHTSEDTKQTWADECEEHTDGKEQDIQHSVLKQHRHPKAHSVVKFVGLDVRSVLAAREGTTTAAKAAATFSPDGTSPKQTVGVDLHLQNTPYTPYSSATQQRNNEGEVSTNQIETIVEHNDDLAQQNSSPQEWQVVGKKNTKTKGVVTRSQTKNANNTWTDKVEDEQVENQTPTRSRRQLDRLMMRLSRRLNNMSLKHVMRSELLAEMAALEEEASML